MGGRSLFEVYGLAYLVYEKVMGDCPEHANFFYNAVKKSTFFQTVGL